mmetsp:Transcript_10218/g.8771  ORF Transcript_10218/g.8771 Transcript_10218/m.8771 type:complete len:123 (-) Transcript_10218:200-568(-)
MEYLAKKQQARHEYKVNIGQTNKRNHSGLPYNPLTHAYHDDEKGRNLMLKDEQRKVRHILRSTNLDARQNCGYNLITGETRKEVEMPKDLSSKFSGYIQGAYTNQDIKGYQNAGNRQKGNFF